MRRIVNDHFLSLVGSQLKLFEEKLEEMDVSVLLVAFYFCCVYFLVCRFAVLTKTRKAAVVVECISATN